MALSKAPVNCNVPALILVAPVYALALLKVSVPEPVFVMPTPVPEITPDNVNFVPVTAIVLSLPKVTAPLNELVPVLVINVPPFNVTASAPTLTPCKSKVAPLATVVPPAVVPNPLACVTTNVPPLIVVVPV